jgi:hypothetical protein
VDAKPSIKRESADDFKKQIDDLKQQVKQYELDKQNLVLRMKEMKRDSSKIFFSLLLTKQAENEEENYVEEHLSSSASDSWTPTEGSASDLMDGAMEGVEVIGDAEIVFYTEYAI